MKITLWRVVIFVCLVTFLVGFGLGRSTRADYQERIDNLERELAACEYEREP